MKVVCLKCGGGLVTVYYRRDNVPCKVGNVGFCVSCDGLVVVDVKR